MRWRSCGPRSRAVIAAGAVAVMAMCACGGADREVPATPAASADERVKTLADAFLDGWFDRNPDQGTYYGVPGRPHDRLTDNSPEALKAWEAGEDAWLAEATAIDPAAIASAPLRATYAIVRETLEGSIGTRICRAELWPVSQMTGWHVNFGYLVTIQPVGSEQARRDALARWSALPKYIDTEIGNLREGIRQRYLAPKGSVRIVIDQLDTLVAQSTGGTPFLSPASRDTSPEFKKAFETLVGGQLTPAFRRYRDFLQNEYLPAAREDIAVAANPDGDRCYEAAIRAHSSLPMSATQVHELGLRQIDRLLNEMRAIAERSFNTSDVKALLERQVAIAMERKEIHPIGRYISGGGYVEGWALYAEALADEMKLFSSDVDRLGMLSSQAFRAARLVVDSGIHVLGWNRQQAIDYMIKAFHDRVLEDGGVPLIYLTQKIRSWISASS